MTTVFFSLLANSVCSLVAGLLVVYFFLWFFRVQPGPWKLFLLSLPFLKIVYDCLRGLPADSILLSGLDPFSLPPRHQLLMIGGGFSLWGPTFQAQFSVMDRAGEEYASSVGDYLVIWLQRSFGPDAPTVLLAIAATVTVTMLVLRLVQGIRFEKQRREDRLTARTLRQVHGRFRSVDIYSSSGFSGSPFTGGVFRPYICLPEDALAKLSADEVEAVIAHELAHVRRFDLVITVCIQTLGDVFWFIPGYRMLSRKIDRLREIVADQWAVESGVSPELLASALVRLKEIPDKTDHFVLYSAFFREGSLLKIRVQRLLSIQPATKARFGWDWIWIRVPASVWIFGTVMSATFGGTHRTMDLWENMAWFDGLLRLLSLNG